MQKSGVTVTRDMVLIEVNWVFLGAFWIKTRIRQGLIHEWLQIFMSRYTLLTMRYYHIINRLRDISSVDCIREFFHGTTENIIYRYK